MKFTSLLLYVIPLRNTLALIVLLLLAGSIISLANPWIAGQLTQAVLTPDSCLIPLKVILPGYYYRAGSPSCCCAGSWRLQRSIWPVSPARPWRHDCTTRSANICIPRL